MKKPLRPWAELLTVGTELVNGSVLNTNASYLGCELTQLGFQVVGQSACPDEASLIQEALGRALNRSDLILVTGGLGPTPDDITRDSIADFFHVPLVLSQAQYRQIVGYYRQRRRRVPEIVKREAYFPANARPVFNRFGIALGFVIEERERIVVVLPGVPGELMRLFETHIKPFLRRKFLHLRPPFVLLVKTIGLSEPTLMRRLGRFFFRLGDFQFGIYPDVGEVALRIYSHSSHLSKRLKAWTLRALRKDIYSLKDETIEEVVGRCLAKKRWTLSVAESCTGGQASEQITSVPGASRYFRGSYVAYQDILKIKELGVPQEVIQKKGAVSRETALAMARGIRKRFHTTLGASVTGIAGPTRGTSKKPVGLVYLAVASAKRQRCWEVRLSGERQQIRARASKKVLEYLWRWIQD